MNHNPPQRSPRHPETTQNLAREGVCTDPGISYLPPPIHPVPPGAGDLLSQAMPERTRLPPVVWEAKAELNRKGYLSLPLKTGVTLPVDLVAWNSRSICFIAVRRSRVSPKGRDILVRFSSLIADLQAIQPPVPIQIQLWIGTRSTFRIYTICPCGIMSGSLP